MNHQKKKKPNQKPQKNPTKNSKKKSKNKKHDHISFLVVIVIRILEGSFFHTKFSSLLSNQEKD